MGCASVLDAIRCWPAFPPYLPSPRLWRPCSILQEPLHSATQTVARRGVAKKCSKESRALCSDKVSDVLISIQSRRLYAPICRNSFHHRGCAPSDSGDANVQMTGKLAIPFLDSTRHRMPGQVNNLDKWVSTPRPAPRRRCGDSTHDYLVFLSSVSPVLITDMSRLFYSHFLFTTRFHCRFFYSDPKADW